jgi:ATP-dependent Lon protease
VVAAAKEMFQKGIEKLERMHPTTPDYSVVYNHLDLMLDLPWEEYTADKYDLRKAKKCSTMIITAWKRSKKEFLNI